MRLRHLLLASGAVLAWAGTVARAQNGANGFPPVAAATPPPAAAQPGNPTDGPSSAVPAKVLFGAAKQPAPIAAAAIGGYAGGCLAGGHAMPIDGPAWQAMRLSRNRNWGHPVLVAWLEKFAVETQKHDGWPGLLVGDISQPRGGPMLTGHASHQIGLDADIWLTPMPDRRLTEKEREDMSAISMLGPDKLSVDPATWDGTRARIVKRAALSPAVERIFVHPAIKKALCEQAGTLGSDRAWLSKVRPMWGHHYHFHVRMTCPKDSASCRPQPAPTNEDGCGKELDDWFKRLTAPPAPPRPPAPPITLDRLPAECRNVLETGVSQGIVRPAAAATAK
jgi:penicillin-insensitive murein endopeptidase